MSKMTTNVSPIHACWLLALLGCTLIKQGAAISCYNTFDTPDYETWDVEIRRDCVSCTFGKILWDPSKQYYECGMGGCDARHSWAYSCCNTNLCNRPHDLPRSRSNDPGITCYVSDSKLNDFSKSRVLEQEGCQSCLYQRFFDEEHGMKYAWKCLPKKCAQFDLSYKPGVVTDCCEEDRCNRQIEEQPKQDVHTGIQCYSCSPCNYAKQVQIETGCSACAMLETTRLEIFNFTHRFCLRNTCKATYGRRRRYRRPSCCETDLCNAGRDLPVEEDPWDDEYEEVDN